MKSEKRKEKAPFRSLPLALRVHHVSGLLIGPHAFEQPAQVLVFAGREMPYQAMFGGFDLVVHAVEQRQPHLGDADLDDAAVVLGARAVDQAVAFEPVEQARHVRRAVEQALAQGAAREPLGVASPKDAKHIVLGLRDAVGRHRRRQRVEDPGTRHQDVEQRLGAG